MFLFEKYDNGQLVSTKFKYKIMVEVNNPPYLKKQISNN